MPKKYIVPLATGFEEVEAITIIDLLRRAEFEIITCGIGDKTITGAHNIPVVCDTTIAEAGTEEDYDGIVLPGGIPGVDNLVANTKLCDLIKAFHGKNKLVGAICAAPAVVLDPLGIIKDKKVTGYPSTHDMFKDGVYDKEPVVISGNVITSQGVGTAIPFALSIISMAKSTDAAAELAEAIVF